MRRTVAAIAAAVAVPATAVTPAAAAAAKPKSPFAWRAVVEGSYGTPWNHDQRMRMVRFMGTHGFNAYVHAPKDDLYQRTNWRDPYPPAQQADFDGEIALARRS